MKHTNAVVSLNEKFKYFEACDNFPSHDYEAKVFIEFYIIWVNDIKGC